MLGARVLNKLDRCDLQELKVKVTVKFTLEQAMKVQRGSKGITTISLTSVLDVGGWSMPCLGHFTPRKETWYPLYKRLGGPQGQSGRVRKISPLPEFNPRTVQDRGC